jgi:hypothetical protein
MTDSTPVRLRWLRFRRRDLLALVVVVGLAAGAFIDYHLRWVQERHRLVNGPCQLGAYSKAPGALWLFSDHGYQAIYLPIHKPGGGPYRLTAAEQERRATFKRSFPEAWIGYVNSDF